MQWSCVHVHSSVKRSDMSCRGWQTVEVLAWWGVPSRRVGPRQSAYVPFVHNEIAEQVVSPDATPLPQCVPTVATRTGVAKLEAVSAVGESILFSPLSKRRKSVSRNARKEVEGGCEGQSCRRKENTDF